VCLASPRRGGHGLREVDYEEVHPPVVPLGSVCERRVARHSECAQFMCLVTREDKSLHFLMFFRLIDCVRMQVSLISMPAPTGRSIWMHVACGMKEGLLDVVEGSGEGSLEELVPLQGDDESTV
jgi:hypothetical protein